MLPSVWTRRALLGGGIGTAASSLALASLPPRKPLTFIVFFEPDSSDISKQGYNTILAARGQFLELIRLRIFIDGHADAAEADGQALSRARAEAVRAALVGKDVPAVRIEVLAFGSSKPGPEGDSIKRPMANRRVEIRPGENMY